MKNALKHDFVKFILIGKIKGLALESKRARAGILKTKKEEAAYNLAARKQLIGIDIRHHLLAYGFLRGIPYQKLERHCGEFNKPKALAIFDVIGSHAPRAYSLPTLADVHAWLAGGC